MSFVGVAPDVVRISAAQVVDIGAAVNRARTAAAIPTTAIAAAAQDEISAAIAPLFAGHGQQYQALSAQVAALQGDFARVLNGSADAYAAAEASNTSLIGVMTHDLINTINAPARLLLGHPLISDGFDSTPSVGQAAATGNSNTASTTNVQHSLPSPLSSPTTGTGGSGKTSGTTPTSSTGAGGATSSSTPNPVVGSIPLGGGTQGIVAGNNGQYIYVANYDAGTVSVIDSLTKAVVTNIQVGINPRDIIISHDGSHVYVSGSQIGGLPGYSQAEVVAISTAYNTVGQPALFNVSNGTAVDPKMAITNDGGRLYAMSDTNNAILVLDTSNNQFSSPPISVNSPFDMTMTPDGQTLYVSARNVSEVVAINTTTNAVTPITLTADGSSGVVQPGYLAMSPDGTRVYVETAIIGTGNDTITTINTVTNNAVGNPAPLANGYNGFADLVMSPHGDHIYVPDADRGTISVFDTATNSVGTPITIGSGNGSSVSRWGSTLSADGHYLYVPSPDGVSVLDTTTNAVTNPFPIDWGQTGFSGAGGRPLGVALPHGLVYLSGGLGTSNVAVIDQSLLSSGTTGGTGTGTLSSPTPTSGPVPAPLNIVTATEHPRTAVRTFL
ncbi:PE domain-containing protein [Mycobacterium paragordonae]|uniref:PE domain-containing protein n=1 Tax=Mycobacterium paragordonae TaxID=1389713 RepID=UPI00105DB806|nr:PE domain-containing protein [Mycobacterium paragordonae]TDK96479.1 PE domain-containing protein [Mycobacterium paragordonae]